MEKVIIGLAQFVNATEFNGLPEYVVHEVKRVILDSIGCAIIGHSTERGKIATELAKKLSGPPESSIIGTNDKVSCTNAAFANGELMNTLDFDAISIKAGGHNPPILISATLALSESIGASGKDLILSTALGLEISHRLRNTVRGISASGPTKDEVHWPAVYGYSPTVLAAAASAAKLLALDQDHVANAVGIAGYLCPPSTLVKFLHTSPVRMTKYGPSGWGAKVGITSALLAKMGYTGDTDLFDGEYGFWRYSGIGKGEWNMEDALEGLGTKWFCHQIQYKQYPCGL